MGTKLTPELEADARKRVAAGYPIGLDAARAMFDALDTSRAETIDLRREHDAEMAGFSEAAQRWIKAERERDEAKRRAEVAEARLALAEASLVHEREAQSYANLFEDEQPPTQAQKLAKLAAVGKAYDKRKTAQEALRALGAEVRS